MCGVRCGGDIIMMRFLRRCIYFLLTVVVLAMIGLLLFAILFDANQFKDDIAQNFEKAPVDTWLLLGICICNSCL